jgi:hypothetical protein
MLDKQRLLHGPYHAPTLRVGDRADCLMRGTVVITSWTDACISWPRCRRPEGKSHCHSCLTPNWPGTHSAKMSEVVAELTPDNPLKHRTVNLNAELLNLDEARS